MCGLNNILSVKAHSLTNLSSDNTEKRLIISFLADFAAQMEKQMEDKK